MSENPIIDEGKQPGAGLVNKIKNWSTTKKVLASLGVVLVAGAALGGGGEENDSAASTTTTVALAAGPGDSSTTTSQAPATTTTALPATTTTTTTPPPVGYDPIVINGSGADVIDFVVPGNAPSVLEVTYTGSGHFAIWSYDADGDRIDLLVNTIGSYSGRLGINLYEGEYIAELEIEGSGNWTLTATHVSEAQSFTGGTFEGSGDDVVLYSGSGNRLTITHSGSRNFTVWSHGNFRDLLVNQIGSFSGTVRLESGVVLLTINADGQWTLSQN